MPRMIMTLATLAALAMMSAGVMNSPTANAAQQELAPDIVRDIQRSLNQRGYGAGSVDGVFGQQTRSAVARFQRDHSLPGAGRVERRTLAALGVTGQPPVGDQTAALAGQKLSPEMVQDVQKELQRLGYDVGRIDGRWGDRTRRALLEFQRERDLAATGRIDKDTLAALEAGGVTQTGEAPPPATGLRQ